MKFKNIFAVFLCTSSLIGCSSYHNAIKNSHEFFNSIGLGDSETKVVEPKFMTAFEGKDVEYINEFFKGYVFRAKSMANNNPFLNQYILSVPNDCNVLLDFDNENKFYKLERIKGEYECMGGSFNMKKGLDSHLNSYMNSVPVGNCTIVNSAIEKYLKAGGRDLTLEDLKKMNEEDSFIPSQNSNNTATPAKVELSDVKEELSDISSNLKAQAKASGETGTIDNIIDDSAKPYKKNGLMHLCSTVDPDKKGLVVGATDDGKIKIVVDNKDEFFSDIPDNFLPCK